MKAAIIPARELDAPMIARWRAFQAADPELQSPFFCPEYAQGVGAAREDAFVAVIEDGGEIAAFLPHHRRPAGVAKPIGGPITDYQGFIAARHFAPSPAALLAACGLSAYDFNHAPEAQELLADGATDGAVSPYADLSAGFDAFAAARPKDGRHMLKETERRARKIEREIGPLRFVLNDPSDAAFHALLAMKNASYARLGVASILDVPWVATAIDSLRAMQGPQFAGLLSAVYAGDRMIAGHFGMRSASVWCWWFNSYDYAMKIYAPGLILLLEAMRAAPDGNLARIDFGRGGEPYKLAFASGATRLLEGSIERADRRAGLLRAVQKQSLKLLARTPLAKRDLPRRFFRRRVTNMRLDAAPSKGKAT